MTIQLVKFAVDFEKAVHVLAVDFTTGRMTPQALFQVSIQHRMRFHVDKTILTYEYLVQLPVVVRIGRLVPCFDFVVAELYELVRLTNERDAFVSVGLCVLRYEFARRRHQHVLEYVQLIVGHVQVVDARRFGYGFVEIVQKIARIVRFDEIVRHGRWREAIRNRTYDKRRRQVFDVAQKVRTIRQSYRRRATAFRRFAFYYVF